ncbi:hypothetical protein PO909_006762 [Leuciscus waleckii]
MSNEECRSPIGLDCCSCCLDLANGCEPEPGQASLGSPTSVNHFKQLREQLHFQNLNTDKLNNIMRQDSLESVVRDPCYLLNEGICNSNIDQTMLSILLFFHSQSNLQNTHSFTNYGQFTYRSGIVFHPIAEVCSKTNSSPGNMHVCQI